MNTFVNYVGKLNEASQRGGFKYKFTNEKCSGPDHAPTFTIDLEIDGKVVSSGTARKLKDAKQAAAKNYLYPEKAAPAAASDAHLKELSGEELQKLADMLERFKNAPLYEWEWTCFDWLVNRSKKVKDTFLEEEGYVLAGFDGGQSYCYPTKLGEALLVEAGKLRENIRAK